MTMNNLQKVHDKINSGEFHVKMKHILLFQHFLNRDYTAPNSTYELQKLISRLICCGLVEDVVPEFTVHGNGLLASKDGFTMAHRYTECGVQLKRLLESHCS